MGTRPEAIKLAPVILEAQRRMIDITIISTGQHADGDGNDVVENILSEFGIDNYSLKFGDFGDKSLGDVLGGMLDSLYDVSFDDETICFVQGDTISTLAGALWAFLKKIPVAYVEAGLRSGNKFSPYPEEMNRKLVSQIADYHFCPTEENVINLLKEGIPKVMCHVTGNTKFNRRQ
jgi:UDP-N-acetylglucosamine 2-epimerase (non-hydrolysing)